MIALSGNGTLPVYKELCDIIRQDGELVTVRGVETREVTHVYLQITNPKRRYVDNGHLDSRYMNYELLSLFVPEIKDVVQIKPNDDMVKLTSPESMIFYGPEVLWPIMEQWRNILSTLAKEPLTRRAIINFRPIKFMPCLSFMHLMIRNNALNMTVQTRSQDMHFGFLHDTLFFQTLQDIFSGLLSVKLGIYTHQIISAHEYTSLKPSYALYDMNNLWNVNAALNECEFNEALTHIKAALLSKDTSVIASSFYRRLVNDILGDNIGTT